MPAAHELREMLGREPRVPRVTVVTIVSAVYYFQFVPSNPWVAVGWRGREASTF